MLVGYCDNDWRCDATDMKSTSGYVFTFGSGIFFWASVKQHSVALSTTEVEYVSASETTTQAIWLRFVFKDFRELQTGATPSYCDNKSAIAMTKNPVLYQDQSIFTNIINLVFCKYEEQLVNIFTKALPKNIFYILKSMLRVKSATTLEGSVEEKACCRDHFLRVQVLWKIFI